MKLFEMSNSYTQKIIKSFQFFYMGIALLLKSLIVLCICFWIWKKHALYWNFVPPAVEDSSQQQAPGFCHRLFQARLSEWWVVLLNPCLLIFALHLVFCPCLFNSVFFLLLLFSVYCLGDLLGSFCSSPWWACGYAIFWPLYLITLVSLWLALIVRCKVLFSRNDHFLGTRPDIRRDEQEESIF